MGDYGVSVTWGEPKLGREKQATELFLHAVTLNDDLVANGTVERWDAILFEPSGNGPGGAVRYYGTVEQMEALVRSEGFLTIVARGEILLHDFGFRRFVTGQALAEVMGRFSTLLDSL